MTSLSLPDGKLAGLPYYAGHNAFIYNEEHLSKSGAAGARQTGTVCSTPAAS